MFPSPAIACWRVERLLHTPLRQMDTTEGYTAKPGVAGSKLPLDAIYSEWDNILKLGENTGTTSLNSLTFQMENAGFDMEDDLLQIKSEFMGWQD